MPVPALREIYEQDPALGKELRNTWRLEMPLDSMLLIAETITHQPDIVAHLDTLSEEDPDSLFEIQKLITSLPGELIYDNYGEEVLVWASANATFSNTAEAYRDTLAEKAGYDKSLLEKARLLCWRRDLASKGKDVLLQYRIMQAITGGQLNEIDVAAHVQQAPREGVELSDKRIASYGLIPLRSSDRFSKPNGPALGFDWEKESEPGVRHSIYLDAPTGFAVTYKGRPNALVTVASSAPDELMIYQLQGITPDKVNSSLPVTHDDYIIGKLSSRGLAPLDWQKLLINLTTDLAQSLNLSSVGLQSAKNNVWTKPRHSQKPHLDMVTATLAYDAPAQRLGFARGPDGNWHRPI